MAQEKSQVKYLAKGIESLGRAKNFSRRGLHGFKGKYPKHEKQAKTQKKDHINEKFYKADKVKKPLNRKVLRNPTKLKSSIKPGSVLILLAGRFKGKRVVFLKQLPSGLLMVTGPYQLNGVPARRVNQKYVIGTQTIVKLPQLDLDSFTDEYFKPVEKSKKKKEFLEGEDSKQKKTLPQEYVESQKQLDEQIAGAIQDNQLKGYLSSMFSLSDGDRPHLMKF